MTDARAFCAPTQEGCSRCQSTGRGSQCPQSAALIMGPADADAREALCETLAAHFIAYDTYDTLVVVEQVRSQLSALATRLQSEMSPYTLASIQAAYAPTGGATVEKRVAALLHAEPLPALLENAEHEWVRDVLEKEWLLSVFHPIVDIHSGKPFAYEALLRAQLPESQELIGAPKIIGACEKLRLQHQLDQRARRAAIRGASQLHFADARIFINFLPNTIYDPKVCLRTTMEAAAEYGIPLDQLVLEVVETEQIDDVARLNHILDYYRERGIGTAVDDMGAGFTSMELLRALRPDYVKIDRDVVRESEQNSRTLHLFEAIVNLARELECKVIAEGIETPAQAFMCRDIGVHYLQGFLFARPANPPESLAYDMSRPLRAAA